MGSELGIWKDRSKGKDRDEERSEARKVAANQKHCYWKKEAKKRSEARKGRPVKGAALGRGRAI